MRKSLELIYADFFEEYHRPPTFNRWKIFFDEEEYNIAQSIKRELKKIEKKFPDVTIRSDAKLFVLVIFHQIVSMPLLAEDKNIDYEILESSISKDIQGLMGQAIENLSPRGGEISAHTVLSLIDRQWNSLNISRHDWWNN